MRRPTHVTAHPVAGVPTVRVASGPVHLRTVVGLTRWHALGRAARWAQRHGGDGWLRVSRWVGDADGSCCTVTFGPDVSDGRLPYPLRRAYFGCETSDDSHDR